MKPNNKKFSSETVRELTALYIPTYHDHKIRFEPIIQSKPPEKPLTVDNFGIVMHGNTYTADDFRWIEENGSDRDFFYDDSIAFDYIDKDDLPNKVFRLLNTIICMKFATSHLADAKAMVDATDNDEAKKAVNEAVENFNKATESEEKLQIAADALYDAAQVFKNIDVDIFETFNNASDVIIDVIYEIDEKS